MAFLLICSLPEQSSDSPEDAVLLGIIRVVFAGNLEDGRKGCRVSIKSMAYPVRNLTTQRQSAPRHGPDGPLESAPYMLVDKDDADVLALRREPVEGGFDGTRVRLLVYYQKVLLRIGRRRYVPDSSKEETRYGVLADRCQRHGLLSLEPSLRDSPHRL